MKYYRFYFFSKLSIQDKINFRKEYSEIKKEKIWWFSNLIKTQIIINKYREKTTIKN